MSSMKEAEGEESTKETFSKRKDTARAYKKICSSRAVLPRLVLPSLFLQDNRLQDVSVCMYKARVVSYTSTTEHATYDKC